MSKLSQASSTGSPASRQSGEDSNGTRRVSCTVKLDKNIHRELRIAAFEADLTIQDILSSLAAAWARGERNARIIVENFVTDE